MKQILATLSIFGLASGAQAQEEQLQAEFGQLASTIPTLSEWGLILLVGLIGLAAFRALHRRK